MVDRLQYQNQIYAASAVPPSQQVQSSQQPQIIIPNTTTSSSTAAAGGSGGGGITVVQQHQQQQRQIINTIPLRHIIPQQHLQPQQLRAVTIQQRNTGIRLIQQQPGQRIVQYQQYTIAPHNVQQFIPLTTVPNGGIVVHHQQQRQQLRHISQQQIINSNQLRPQGQYRAFAVQHRTTAIRQLGHQGIIRSTTSTQYRTVVHPVPVKNEEVVMATTAITHPSLLSSDTENITTVPAATAGSNIPSSNTADDNSVMTIAINNVVCNYSLPMHIDLRRLALNTWNCTYDRSGSILTKQKRHPSCHVKVYNSGKVYIVGSKSEAEARQAARGVGREIQKIMGKTDQKISLRKFKINNILATCKFPFGILIDQVNRQYPKETYYEPELTVGLIWRMTEPKASIRIHTTGTIVVTGATSEADVSTAVEKIYNYVKDFRCDPTKISHAAPRKRKAKPPTRSSTEDEFASVARKIPKFEDADDVDCIEAGLNTMFADEVDIDEEF